MLERKFTKIGGQMVTGPKVEMFPDRRPLRTSPDSHSQGSNCRPPSSVQTLPHRPHSSADRIACCAAHVTAAPRRATTQGE